jgi:hypothetical protein
MPVEVTARIIEIKSEFRTTSSIHCGQLVANVHLYSVNLA